MTTQICDNYTITFIDGFSRYEKSKVICFISVKENKQKNCYVLDYLWQVILGDTEVSKNDAYPFILCEDDTDGEGVIVAKNEMTTQMILHLVMPDSELIQICGVGTTPDYRAKIIRSLATLWD